MITNAILFTFYKLLNNVFLYPILVQPDVSLTSGVGSAIATAGTYLANINVIFPLSTLLICLGVILTMESVILIYKLVMWVIRRIPGQG